MSLTVVSRERWDWCLRSQWVNDIPAQIASGKAWCQQMRRLEGGYLWSMMTTSCIRGPGIAIRRA